MKHGANWQFEHRAGLRPRLPRLLFTVMLVGVAAASLGFAKRGAVSENKEPPASPIAKLALPRQTAASGQRLPFEPLVPKGTAIQPPVTMEGDWRNITVAAGDNLSLIFSRLGLSKGDLHRIMQLGTATAQLKRIKPGQLVRFNVRNGRLEAMVLEIDELNSLHVERTESGFSAHTVAVEPEIKVAMAAGEITQSLFIDGQRVGLSDPLILLLTEIFGWDIDFALDLREHDQFKVIYEDIYKDEQRIKQGRILAAEFVNRGKRLRAVLYGSQDGEPDYYSDSGDRMRKAFLRTPVNFTRISSRFNLRRKHPILNTIRAHRGVDYAAPQGTPIHATAHGKVKFMGNNGGYGMTVIMQHGEVYSTLYAHLSRPARGIKRGRQVSQGQVIGYVGKTGLATGPHLHYEFRINDVHRNPLTVDLPEAEPIDARYLDDFRYKSAPLLAQLDSLVVADHAVAGAVVAQLNPNDLLLPTAVEPEPKSR